jgi:plasmid stabilization system protein ParE
MRKMTIHRALSELKLLDNRISSTITTFQPTGIYQKGKLVNGIVDERSFAAKAQSDYDSITDLIKQKFSIKAAIIQSNSKTTVTIGEKTMTVADAIVKKTIINSQKQLLDKMKQALRQSQAVLTKNNELVESNLQKILEHTLGKDSVKATKEDIDAVSKPFKENNEFHMMDTLDIQKRIDDLQSEIATFEAEVDAVLSESNAVTVVEID